MDKAKVRMLSGGAPPKGSCFYETQLVSLTHFHLVPGLTFDVFKLDLLLSILLKYILFPKHLRQHATAR